MVILSDASAGVFLIAAGIAVIHIIWFIDFLSLSVSDITV